METSIEDVCCLEIPEICKPRFSSTWCLYVCRLESHFAQLYSSRENFISYLNSTQCWSLANQNKSFLSLQTLQLSFSVKYFTILIRSFFLYKMFFLWAYFLKENIQFDSRVCYYWKAIPYCQNRWKRFTGTQKPFKWCQNVRDTFSWNLKKY